MYVYKYENKYSIGLILNNLRNTFLIMTSIENYPYVLKKDLKEVTEKFQTKILFWIIGIMLLISFVNNLLPDLRDLIIDKNKISSSFLELEKFIYMNNLFTVSGNLLKFSLTSIFLMICMYFKNKNLKKDILSYIFLSIYFIFVYFGIKNNYFLIILSIYEMIKINPYSQKNKAVE